MLQARLTHLYSLVNTGFDRFPGILLCKDQIRVMRDEVTEGGRVRAGVEEQLFGEQLSQFLFRKEKEDHKSVLLTGLHMPDDSVLSNTDGVFSIFRRCLRIFIGWWRVIRFLTILLSVIIF